jgi:hypothetical protein
MTDEQESAQLQADTVTLDSGDATPPESNDQLSPDGDGSGLAPDAGADQSKKVEFDEGQQNLVNEIVGKKTAKTREAVDRAETAEKRVAELESQVPSQTRPEVPPPISRYDENYDAKSAERDQLIIAQANFDADARSQQKATQSFEQQQAYDNQQKFVKQANSYTERATAAGISEEVLKSAGKTIVEAGVSEDLAMHIVAHPEGPQLTQFLGGNAQEADKIASMDLATAGAYIETHIRPQLDALKPKPSGAPPPADLLTGAGVAPQVLGGKDVTYE